MQQTLPHLPPFTRRSIGLKSTVQLISRAALTERRPKSRTTHRENYLETQQQNPPSSPSPHLTEPKARRITS